MIKKIKHIIATIITVTMITLSATPVFAQEATPTPTTPAYDTTGYTYTPGTDTTKVIAGIKTYNLLPPIYHQLLANTGFYVCLDPDYRHTKKGYTGVTSIIYTYTKYGLSNGSSYMTIDYNSNLSNMALYINTSYSDYQDAILHEIGHWFSWYCVSGGDINFCRGKTYSADLFGISWPYTSISDSSNKTWDNIVKAEAPIIQYYDNDSYFYAPKEYFAESFACYYSDPTLLASKAPMTYAYIDNLIQTKIMGGIN